MEPEMTSDDLLSKRNRLMNEVVSLRRKVPKTLISLDQKIQKKELKELLLRKYTSDALQEQLCNHIRRTFPGEDRRIPNWKNDFQSIKSALKEGEEGDALLKQRLKNSIDFNSLMAKLQEAQRLLVISSRVRKQLSEENPLITKARHEGCQFISHQMPERQEKENLEMETEIEKQLPLH